MSKVLILLVVLGSYQVKALEKTWSALAGYSAFDTWLPGKINFTGVYGDKIRTYELSLQQASYGFDVLIDGLGSVTDRRVHLSRRSFRGTSFNWQYGVSYHSFEASLGSEYTDIVSGRYEAVNISSLGLMWGMGNRWSFENGFTMGVDWLRIFYPVFLVNSEAAILDELGQGEDKEDIQELIDGVAGLPTFSLLSFELGYRF